MNVFKSRNFIMNDNNSSCARCFQHFKSQSKTRYEWRVKTKKCRYCQDMRENCVAMNDIQRNRKIKQLMKKIDFESSHCDCLSFVSSWISTLKKTRFCVVSKHREEATLRYQSNSSKKAKNDEKKQDLKKKNKSEKRFRSFKCFYSARRSQKTHFELKITCVWFKLMNY